MKSCILELQRPEGKVKQSEGWKSVAKPRRRAFDGQPSGRRYLKTGLWVQNTQREQFLLYDKQF